MKARISCCSARKRSSLPVDLGRAVFGDTTKRCSETNRARLGGRVDIERERGIVGERGNQEGLRYPRGTFSPSPRIRRPVLSRRQKGSRAVLGSGRGRGRVRIRFGDKNVKQKADYVTEGWNTSLPRRGERTGRAIRSPSLARHNRVIFTRDLGGDFAREENAPVRLPSRVLGLSFCAFRSPSKPASFARKFLPLPPSLSLLLSRSWDMTRRGYFNVAARLLFPTSLLFEGGEANHDTATNSHPHARPSTKTPPGITYARTPGTSRVVHYVYVHKYRSCQFRSMQDYNF